MKMKKIFTKTLLLAALLAGGVSSAWADDKTVVKYSFDDASSPAVTAGNRVALDYAKSSVITSTSFLNAYNNQNGDPGSSTISLGSTDLSTETWTLSFEWAAVGGCNSKADHTTLKAGDTNLFDLSGNSNWNTTVTLSVGGTATATTLPVPGCDKSKRFTANTGDQMNTTAYWHHIVITGSSDGVKLTITNSNSGAAIVTDLVLSDTNVNPTGLVIEPCCGGAIGIDELSLTYYVEGEVIQTPVAAYTAVDGINRTITATCETEGATLYYSTDGENWTEGASVTVSKSGNVYFKGVKGNSESDVLTFAAEAGTEIQLNAPTINRTSNTSVTITADQTNKLLSPTATIYYEYGAEKGSFTGSKVLTVAADATITAYAEASGYTTSETSERAVALFPENVETLENTSAKTAGWANQTWGDSTVVSERKYAHLLLDEVQWGKIALLQKNASWSFRASGNWYNNSTANSYILFPGMKAGDIIVVDITYPASDVINATASKYTYGTRYAYEVTADGDVELGFKKPSASDMDYLYGVYAYRIITSVSKTITAAGYATFCSEYALDFTDVEGLYAYIAKCEDYENVTFEPVNKIPANTGVLLKGNQGTYNIPVTASGDYDDVEGNIFIGVLEDTHIDGIHYVLMNGDKGIGFYYTNQGEFTVGANTAYISGDGIFQARTFIWFEESGTTGIQAPVVKNLNAGDIYTLGGQRVAKPTKGLYIMNGKKVVVK